MSELDATARIARVTVYEDRADVVREALLELPPGATTVIVRGVAPVVSDEQVVAHIEQSGDAPPAVVVNDVRVERRIDDGAPVAADAAARRAARHAELERIDDEIAAARRVLDRHQLAHAEALATLARYVDAAARAAGRGDAAAAATAGALATARARIDQLNGARDAARRQVHTLERARARAAADARPPAVEPRVAADLHVALSGSGGRVKLVISTLVPCAAWRPTHEARLQGTTVRFETYASVWNATGEAWPNVELTFSTARPSAGAELPALSADRLTLRTKTPEERRTIVVEHREETLPEQATKGTAPGVDDGGQPRVFRAAGVSVASDGRPQRVLLGAFEAPCATERVAFPELAPQVFLRASLKNAGGGPILAGPVTLVVDGAYTGTGDLLYTGPGEAFDLSFGSDDRFTVRTKKRRIEDKKLIGQNVVHFVREATLAQTGATSERVLVHLRVPVSELAQVKVLLSPQHGTEPDAKPDANGLLRIPVQLEPNVERRVAVAFSFETSGDVRVPDPW
ncbi:MAG: DUF4139 domain-containing protein [Deltaproteobacteria bacterium]|nr:DUF4139 domain-containing protein [Deltaproteobacteria bacterium]